jgi:hypothetical protein
MSSNYYNQIPVRIQTTNNQYHPHRFQPLNGNNSNLNCSPGIYNQINAFDPFVLAKTEMQRRFLEVLQVQRKFFEQEKLYNLLQTLEKIHIDLGQQQIMMFDNNAIIDSAMILKYIPKEMYAIARHMAKTTDTDIFSCVMSLCSATAIAMRGRHQVRLDRHWAETINLYILLAKNSGENKSTLCEMLNHPTRVLLSGRRKPKAPKNDRRSQMQPTILNAAKAYERAVIDRYTRKIRKSGESISCISAMMDELESVRDEFSEYIQEKRTREEIFIDVTTSLGLVKKLESNGETIAIMEPEAGMFLSRFFKDKSLVPILLKGYGCEPYQYDTSTPGKCVYLDRPSINILLMLQNSVMFGLFNNEFLAKIGLFPRMLPILGGNFKDNPMERYTIDGLGATPDWMALYEEKIQSILEQSYTKDTDREIFDIPCEPDARLLALNFRKENWECLKAGQYLHMAPFMRKLHGTAVRIAGCIHGWTFSRPHDHPITVKEMEAGIAFAKICRDHANIAFDTKLRETVHFAIKILKYLLKQDWTRSQPLISASDLQRNISGLNKAKCLPALDFHEQHNFIRQHHEPKYAPLVILHPNLSQVTLDHLTDI